MLDQFQGLPVHVLVVHAVVVLAPLAALLALIYAWVPRLRQGLRWPLALMALATGGSGLLAAESGERFEHRLTGGGVPTPALHEHTEAGDLLKVACLAFMLLTLAAVLWLLRPRPEDRPRPVAAEGATSATAPTGRRGRGGPLALVTAVVLTLASVGLTYQTVVTGHSGAQAVWGAHD